MSIDNLLKKGLPGILAGVILLAGPAAHASKEDPWEGMNRKIFAFNEFVDRYVLKPVARAYDWITPKPVDDHVTNVFENLEDVGIFLNDVLQGKFSDASTDAGRFLINSSIGVAGIFDVATSMGLEKHEEDFGQTFASWKIASGPYVVLPFFGPSTLRDAVGRIPGAYAMPQRYIDHVPTRNSIYGVDIVDTRSDLLKAEELIQGDRYTFIRDVYLQRREFLIADGEVEDDFTSDDLEDE